MAYEKTKYDNVYSKEVGQRTCYFARFRFKLKNKRGVTPYKNLTSLFGCTTPKQAYEKIFELKQFYNQGIDPFFKDNEIISVEKTLNHLWEDYIEEIKEKGRKEDTIKLYTKFYDNYCRTKIGNKEISKITKDEVLLILKQDLKGKSGSYKKRLKLILGPIFDDAVENEVIASNFLTHRQFELEKYVPYKPKISEVTELKHLEIAKILYNYIPKYPTKNSLKEQLPVFTLLNLMTGHRYGELVKLTTKNLDLENMRIKAFRSQTKTKITTYYPYPEECNKYFEKFKDIKDERKLFPDILLTSYGILFKIILRKALEERGIPYFNIVAHDFRQLLLNSMISLGIDATLANKICLDHSYGDVLDAYLDMDFNLKQKTYNIYWEALRN